MLKIYRRDKVIARLMKLSWFKEGELDSLLCYGQAVKESKTLKYAVQLRDKKVSLGSFSRSYKQGRRVISRSFATMLLSLLLGFVTADAIEKIPNLSGLLLNLREHAEDSDAVVQLLEEFFDTMM